MWDWCNMVVKFIDYLANPKIVMKHREVFDYLFNNYLNYFELSDTHGARFELCKDKISQLVK